MSPLIQYPLQNRIINKMAIYDLRKKTKASTGQRVVMDPNKVRMSNLENRINNQEQKLDKIIELLQNGNNLPNANKQSS